MMLPKPIIWICILLAIGLGSCTKWDLDQRAFLQSGAINTIDLATREASAELIGLNGRIAEQHGHVWSYQDNLPSVNINDGITELGLREIDGLFTSTVSELLPNTTYVVRPYARIGS